MAARERARRSQVDHVGKSAGNQHERLDHTNFTAKPTVVFPFDLDHLADRRTDCQSVLPAEMTNLDILRKLWAIVKESTCLQRRLG
jgi:hypothetical protein